MPEVEIMVRNLRRWTAGRRVSGVHRLDTRLSEDVAAARGGRITAAWRRGKYAVLDVQAPKSGHLVLHFRMTGKVVPAQPERRFKPRMVLEIEGADAIAFEDPRCLGEVWWVGEGKLDRFFAARRLGPEPWPVSRDGAWWGERLGGLRCAVKPALMRQDRIAGLGNIAATEICWMARIHPATPTPHLTQAHFEAISHAVPTFIERTLRAESGDEIHYVNLGGSGSFSVYGAAGQPCPRCGSAIVRIAQAGRGTFLCPDCQVLLPSCV